MVSAVEVGPTARIVRSIPFARKREIEIGTAGKAGRAIMTNWPGRPARKAGSRSVSERVVVSSVSSRTEARRAIE